MKATIVRFSLVAAIGMAACAPAGKELVGDWKMVRSISKGEEVKSASSLNNTRTFDGRNIIMGHAGKASGRARYLVDERSMPKRISIEYLDGPLAGTVRNGIFEVSGRTLRICVTHDGSAAPVKFDSPLGSEVSLDIYERTR